MKVKNRIKRLARRLSRGGTEITPEFAHVAADLIEKVSRSLTQEEADRFEAVWRSIPVDMKAAGPKGLSKEYKRQLRAIAKDMEKRNRAAREAAGLDIDAEHIFCLVLELLACMPEGEHNG